jgi:hypothetical protein
MANLFIKLCAELYAAMDFRVASFCPAPLQTIMAPTIVEIPA